MMCVSLANYRKEEWRNEGRVKKGRGKGVYEIVVSIRGPLNYLMQWGFRILPAKTACKLQLRNSITSKCLRKIKKDMDRPYAVDCSMQS
jgi:hypothetical protein